MEDLLFNKFRLNIIFCLVIIWLELKIILVNLILRFHIKCNILNKFANNHHISINKISKVDPPILIILGTIRISLDMVLINNLIMDLLNLNLLNMEQLETQIIFKGKIFNQINQNLLNQNIRIFKINKNFKIIRLVMN